MALAAMRHSTQRLPKASTCLNQALLQRDLYVATQANPKVSFLQATLTCLASDICVPKELVKVSCYDQGGGVTS